MFIFSWVLLVGNTENRESYTAFITYLYLLKPCSEKSGIIYWKSKILVRMTDFGDSNANRRRIYKILIILYSNRILDMHFRKTIPYISWFRDPELWEWLGADPHNFRRRCFSYAPEPNYTNFKQKISMKSYKNDFFLFFV